MNIAVPTAKTAYVLASAYQVEARVAGLVVSMTTLMSLITLLGWPATNRRDRNRLAVSSLFATGSRAPTWLTHGAVASRSG